MKTKHLPTKRLIHKATRKPSSTTKHPALDFLLRRYVDDFIAKNRAAQVIAQGLKLIGVGFWPIIDHLTFRTFNVEERAREFFPYGYEYDHKLGVIEYENWWAKVYRKPEYPAIFIDQAYAGERGQGSLIPDWVRAFGNKTLHHIAIKVDDIDNAVYYLEKQGVAFTGKVVGGKGSDLRQIFTDPERVQGKAFSVIELTERHHGYTGFLPPQAQGLMESTRVSPY